MGRRVSRVSHAIRCLFEPDLHVSLSPARVAKGICTCFAHFGSSVSAIFLRKVGIGKKQNLIAANDLDQGQNFLSTYFFSPLALV